jgi:eukaryotic-like serine/threonine-protein kinase
MSTSILYCPACGAANDRAETHCHACQSKLDATVAMPLLHERYCLLTQLGVGGFGAVYRAVDTHRPELPIAIKEINLDGLNARQAIEATETFERERRLLANLDHPRVPHLYATFEDAQHWYLVIDYFPGETLEVRLTNSQARQRLASASPDQALRDELLRFGLALCDILHYLHTRLPPLIFRDLKPGNIICCPDGSYALVDFGIARTFKAGLAKDTIPLGSPGYAAPEQYGRAQTDVRADIYSLGADSAPDAFGTRSQRTTSALCPPGLHRPHAAAPGGVDSAHGRTQNGGSPSQHHRGSTRTASDPGGV